MENAVQHGLMPKTGDGTVRIEARRKDEILEITVMDDGVGMTEEILAALKDGLDQDETAYRLAAGRHMEESGMCVTEYAGTSGQDMDWKS